MTDNTATTILPFLTVANGEKAVAFYKTAFAANEIIKHKMPDEKLTAKLAVEGALFYVGDEEPQFGNIGPDEKSNSPVRIILQTRRADELFEKAIEYGATEICPMTTEEDWRIGKLKDPFGHIWELGYPLQSQGD